MWLVRSLPFSCLTPGLSPWFYTAWDHADAVFTVSDNLPLALAAVEDRAIDPAEIDYTVDVNAPHPILNLTKAVEIGGGNEVSLGGVVTCTLVISNGGDAMATDGVLPDLLPPAVIYGAQISRGTVIKPLPGRLLKWGPADIPFNLQDIVP